MIVQMEQSSNKDQLRSNVLQQLDEWNQVQPVPVAVQELAQALGQDSNAVFSAVQYLSEKGLVRHFGELGGLGLAQITAAGIDVVENPQRHRNDPGIGGTVTYITDNRGATVTTQQVGSDNVQNTISYVFNHPHAQELQSAISNLKTGLAADTTLDEYRKEDAEGALSAIEGELAKPVERQDKGRLAHKAQQLVGLASGATTLVALADAIQELLESR